MPTVLAGHHVKAGQLRALASMLLRAVHHCHGRRHEHDQAPRTERTQPRWATTQTTGQRSEDSRSIRKRRTRRTDASATSRTQSWRGRRHSRRQRHALACRIRAPMTHRWHHCPSHSRLLHRVLEAAVDMVIMSQRPAVPQGSAPRALILKEQIGETGLRPTLHAVGFVAEEKTRAKE